MANVKIEDSPEFQKALNEACEGQYRGWLYGGDYAKASSKDTIGTTMEEIQRQRQKIEDEFKDARLHADRLREEARIMSDPHLREITENLRRIHGQDGGLVCPSCGDVDHHNRMNGRAWCMKCNLPLMSAKKAKKWIKPQPPKNWLDDFGKIDQARVRK